MAQENAGPRDDKAKWDARLKQVGGLYLYSCEQRLQAIWGLQAVCNHVGSTCISSLGRGGNRDMQMLDPASQKATGIAAASQLYSEDSTGIEQAARWAPHSVSSSTSVVAVGRQHQHRCRRACCLTDQAAADSVLNICRRSWQQGWRSFEQQLSVVHGHAARQAGST